MENIRFIEGDIQVSDKQTIVLPVSCDGRVESDFFHPVLRRYPDMWARYLEICRKGMMSRGKLWIYRSRFTKNVLVFPVRDSVMDDYSLDYVRDGLQKFVGMYQKKRINS